MRSLFARVMIGSLIAVAVFVVVTAVAIASSVNISLAGWTQLRESEIRASIATSLRRVFSTDSRPSNTRIAEALEPQLQPGMYVAVFDPQLNPVFVYRPETQGLLQPNPPPQSAFPRFGADRGAGPHREMMGPRGRAGPARPPSIDELTPVRVGGETRAYFIAGSQGFVADTANRRLIRTLLIAVFAGVAAALALSTGVSFVFSRRLASETGTLAAGLRELQAGNRSVAFPTEGTAELADIAASADSLQKELDHQENLRHQWAQDIAHDLRTPVAALRSQLEAMADGVLQATGERLNRTLVELGRLESLIVDLRTLTQLESPELSLSSERIAVDELAKETAARFALLASERETDIELELEHAVVKGDRSRLERALSNVVANAVQYNPVGGTVRLDTATVDDSQVAITVENPGTIAEEELPYVFDRLYRGEASRTSPGSGLGLTIARQIVKHHGGRITIANRPGPAVRVEILLPRLAPSDDIVERE